jgi:hypothetical protein
VARRSALREVLADRMLVAALAAVWLSALLPIWIPRFLPLLDFPNHLGAMAILHRHGDPSWGYDKFYTLNLKPAPYWGHYFPVHVLAYLVPLEVANKIWISAVALALPLGTATLARQIGRSPWLALLVAPFVFSFCFAMGFLSFCGGLAVFPWAFYTLESFLDEPTVGRGVALALLACVLYLMHVMPWVVFGLGAGVILCSHGWRPKRMLVAAGCLLVSVALALSGLLQQQKWSTATTAAKVTHEGGWTMRFDTFRVAVRGLKDRWLVNLPHGWTTVMELVLLASLVALIVTALWARSEQQRGFRWRYEVVLVICLLLYFCLPQTLYTPLAWWYIAGRMTAFLAVVLALSPRGAIEGRRRLILIPALIISLAFPVVLAVHWYRFDTRTRGFARLMKTVPRGSSTLVLMLGHVDDPDADKNSLPFLEFHALAQVLGGGFDPWSQATPLGGFPMSPIPEKTLPAPYYSRPQDFSFDRYGAYYDYILTRNERETHSTVNDARAWLVGTDGPYRLYRVEKEPMEP